MKNTMKKMFGHLPIALMAMTLAVGCGKDENSSGSSSTAAPAPVKTEEVTNAAQNFKSLDEIRQAFDKKSMAAASGLDIYHTGTYFGANSGFNIDTSFDFSGCINLIFWSAGDCGGYEQQQKTILEQMDYILDSGRLIKVDSSDSSSLNVKEALDVNNDASFLFSDPYQLTREDILGDALRKTSYYGQPQFKEASIKLSDGRDIKGVAIIKQTGEVFVLSTNLPLVANPILVQSNQGYGQLSKIGADVHVNEIRF